MHFDDRAINTLLRNLFLTLCCYLAASLHILKERAMFQFKCNLIRENNYKNISILDNESLSFVLILASPNIVVLSLEINPNLMNLIMTVDAINSITVDAIN